MTDTLKSVVEEELQKAYERGVQDGMNREHALWVLAKIGQEIEIETEEDKVKIKKDELEYCPHGKYINYSCNSCDAEEHADRIHSYGE